MNINCYETWEMSFPPYLAIYFTYVCRIIQLWGCV